MTKEINEEEAFKEIRLIADALSFFHNGKAVPHDSGDSWIKEASGVWAAIQTGDPADAIGLRDFVDIAEQVDDVFEEET